MIMIFFMITYTPRVRDKVWDKSKSLYNVYLISLNIVSSASLKLDYHASCAHVSSHSIPMEILKCDENILYFSLLLKRILGLCPHKVQSMHLTKTASGIEGWIRKTKDVCQLRRSTGVFYSLRTIIVSVYCNRDRIIQKESKWRHLQKYNQTIYK